MTYDFYRHLYCVCTRVFFNQLVSNFSFLTSLDTAPDSLTPYPITSLRPFDPVLEISRVDASISPTYGPSIVDLDQPIRKINPNPIAFERATIDLPFSLPKGVQFNPPHHHSTSQHHGATRNDLHLVPPPLAAAETLPIRGYLFALYAHAHGKIHSQCVACSTSTSCVFFFVFFGPLEDSGISFRGNTFPPRCFPSSFSRLESISPPLLAKSSGLMKQWPNVWRPQIPFSSSSSPWSSLPPRSTSPNTSP